MSKERIDNVFPENKIGIGIQVYEVKQKLPKELLSDLLKFIGDEDRHIRVIMQREENKEAQLDAEEEEKWASAMNHRIMFNNVRDELRESDTRTALLIIARNDSLNDVVGFSTNIITSEGDKKAKNVYVGVKREYRRKGIAKTLIAVRQKALLERGIDSYETSVSPQSYNLYRSLQESQLVQFVEEERSEQDQLYGKNKRLTVKIQEPILRRYFESVGLDYNQNPLAPRNVEVR